MSSLLGFLKRNWDRFHAGLLLVGMFGMFASGEYPVSFSALIQHPLTGNALFFALVVGVIFCLRLLFIIGFAGRLPEHCQLQKRLLVSPEIDRQVVYVTLLVQVVFVGLIFAYLGAATSSEQRFLFTVIACGLSVINCLLIYLLPQSHQDSSNEPLVMLKKGLLYIGGIWFLVGWIGTGIIFAFGLLDFPLFFVDVWVSGAIVSSLVLSLFFSYRPFSNWREVLFSDGTQA